MKCRQLRFLGLAIMAFATPGISSALSIQADSPWSLRLPKEELVPYRGVVSLDSAGTKGSGMLYPAPSAAGFIAALVTHGFLVESQKDAQKQALQETADRVLTPYRPVLNGYKHLELMQGALDKTVWGADRKLIDPAESRDSSWIVESTPFFSMTQDQKALVLDNVVSVYEPGELKKPVYRSTVRVVSQPRTDQDLETFWKGNEGFALKAESVSLLAHSLSLALREVSKPATNDVAAFRTVRYREGATEKIERAQVVSLACRRQVIRTLRGWLMSVPSEALADAPCEPALPGWQ